MAPACPRADLARQQKVDRFPDWFDGPQFETLALMQSTTPLIECTDRHGLVRDVEQRVLARALKLVSEDRAFRCGNRTVIFD